MPRHLSPPPLRALAALLALLVAAAPSLAQSFESDPFDKRLGAKKRNMQSYAKSPNAADKQLFTDYIRKYHLPAMTQSSPEGLEDLGKLRYDLFNSFIWPAAPTVQKDVTKDALRFAGNIVRSRKYHPAVTYNALLILGMLDDEYAAPGRPSKPSATANKALVGLASKAAKDARYPRYWFVAALVGLERHCKSLDRLPPDSQKRTIATLGGVLSAKQLAGDYDDGVLDWVYLSAAQGLANTGSAGEKGRRLLAVVKRVADKDLLLETRASLAATLDDFNAQAGQFNATPAVDAVLGLAADIAKQERKYAQEFEDTQVRNRRSQSSNSGRSKTHHRFKVGDDRRIVLVRDGLLSLLTDLKSGVDAVTPLANEDQTSKLQAISSAIGQTNRMLSDEDQIDLSVAGSVKQMARDIESLVGADQGEGDEEEAF